MIKNLGQVAAIYVGENQPRNTNMIWLDNGLIPYAFKAYNGIEWSEIPNGAWVKAFVNGWLVSLPAIVNSGDDDCILLNSNGVNYKITVKDFVKSSVGNPLDFKGVIRKSSDFPEPSTLEGGDMYIIITTPSGGTVTDPYSGKTFSDSEKIVWDEVLKSWESLGKIDVSVDLSTTYSSTDVTIHSSAGKETTIKGTTDESAGVMLPGQKLWLDALSDGSLIKAVVQGQSPAHRHDYNDLVNRLIVQQGTGDSIINPMSQKAVSDALNLKFDIESILQVSGVATDKVMSQKAVTDALQALKDDTNTNFQKYLPLAGGTMTGNITFTNGTGIRGIRSDGSASDVLLTLGAKDNLNLGNLYHGISLNTSNVDVTHYRVNKNYIMWDEYNLPDPVKLSADNSFTGTNSFTNPVTIGNPLTTLITLNPSSKINLTQISNNVARAYSLTLGDANHKGTFSFGAYRNTTDVDNIISYGYIALPDETYANSSYKFYSDEILANNLHRLITNSDEFKIVKRNSRIATLSDVNNNVTIGNHGSLQLLTKNGISLTHKFLNEDGSSGNIVTIYDSANLKPIQQGANTLTSTLSLNGTDGGVQINDSSGNIDLNSIVTTGQTTYRGINSRVNNGDIISFMRFNNKLVDDHWEADSIILNMNNSNYPQALFGDGLLRLYSKDVTNIRINHLSQDGKQNVPVILSTYSSTDALSRTYLGKNLPTESVVLQTGNYPLRHQRNNNGTISVSDVWDKSMLSDPATEEYVNTNAASKSVYDSTPGGIPTLHAGAYQGTPTLNIVNKVTNGGGGAGSPNILHINQDLTPGDNEYVVYDYVFHKGTNSEYAQIHAGEVFSNGKELSTQEWVAAQNPFLHIGDIVYSAGRWIINNLSIDSTYIKSSSINVTENHDDKTKNSVTVSVTYELADGIEEDITKASIVYNSLKTADVNANITANRAYVRGTSHLDVSSPSALQVDFTLIYETSTQITLEGGWRFLIKLYKQV